MAHDGLAIFGAPRCLSDSGHLPFEFRILNKQAQTFSFEIFRWGQSAEIRKRRIKINELNSARADSFRLRFGQHDDERHARDFLKEQLLLPLSVLAE